MKFDPDALNYIFSTEQEISITETARLRKTLMENASKPLSAFGASTPGAIIAVVVFIAFFVAFIVSGVTGHAGICVFLLGLMFFIGGVGMLISKPKEVFSTERSYLRPRQNAFFVLLIGGLIMAAPLLIGYFSRENGNISPGKVLVILFGSGFALAGGFFLLSCIAGIVKSSRGFGFETEGECIGYVRSFHSHNDTYHRTVVTSPVFEYYHDGQLLQAISSEVYFKKVPIAVGDRVTLNVDPEDPWTIFEQTEGKKAGHAAGIIFASIFIIAGSILIWFGATHDIEMQNPGSTDRKSQITDSYVEEKFGLEGEEWTIAEYTVTEMTYEGDGAWTITLSDGSFRNDPDGSFQSKHEVGFRFYEVTDSSGTPVASFSAEDWEYAGSRDCRSYE